MYKKINSMEEKKQTFELAEQILNNLINLKQDYKGNILGSSLINIFDSVSKFNEINKNFIANMYKPYESIYDDVLSSFENPNCTCRKRFSSFIEENEEVSKNVFFSLLGFLNQKDGERIVKTLQSFYDHFKILSEEKNSKPLKEQDANSGATEKDKGDASPAPGAGEQSLLLPQNSLKTKKQEAVDSYHFSEGTSYIGKSFFIEKTQEAYSYFFENLSKNKAQYNGLSVIPHNLNQMMILFY